MRLKLQIGTTQKCNARCVICPHSQHLAEEGVMSDEVFLRVVEAAKSLGPLYKLALYMQGEPLTDPALEDRIRYVTAALDFGFLELSTNAALMTDERRASLLTALTGVPSWVHVSFHGTTAKEYEAVTGLDFAETWTRILAFFNDTAGTDIRRTLVVASLTPAKVKEWYAGAFAGWDDPPGLKVFEPNNRAGQVKGAPAVENTPEHFQRCVRLREWLHVDWQGRVVLCCNDYSRRYVFGDVDDESLAETRKRIPDCVGAGMNQKDRFPCYSCDMRLV